MTLKAFNEVKIKFDEFDDLQWPKSTFRALKVAAPGRKNRRGTLGSCACLGFNQ